MKIKKTFKQISALFMLVATNLYFSSSMVMGAYDPTTGNLNGSYNLNGSRGSGGLNITNSYGLPSGSILGILSNLLFWLLALFAILGIIGFVISGIMYLLAGVDEDNAKKGKKGMTASIIGIIIGLSGFIVMQAVSSMLTGADRTF